jgi:heat shock protein HslJ
MHHSFRILFKEITMRFQHILSITQRAPILGAILPFAFLLSACVSDSTGGGSSANDLTPQKMSGSAWGVMTITGLSVVESNKSTLNFVNAEQVQGSGGCNSFSGAMKVEGGVLRLGPIIATKRGCVGPIQAQEDRFLKALADVRGMKMQGEDLVLTNDKGEVLSRLRKM